MIDYDLNLDPGPLLGVGWLALVALALGSALLWGEVLNLAWRMLG